MKKNLRYALTGLALLSVFGLGVFTVALLRPADVPNRTSAPAANETSLPARAKIKRSETPKNATFQEWISAGDLKTYRGSFDEAIADYQKAAELEPKAVAPYEKIADASFYKKNYETARKNYEFASSADPKNPELKIKTVRSLLGARKIVEAKTKLESIAPESQKTLYYRGLIAAFLNDQGASKDLLAKSMAAGHDETLKIRAQGILTVYQEFDLERDGRIEHLQGLLAREFDAAEEYGLAIELAFDALKTAHDYRDVWIILGHAFLNERKWFDAQDALAKAIALDAGRPAAYFFRGVANFHLEKFSAAAADFENALKLGWQPKILAKQYLADSAFALQDLPKAFALYKEIVTTDPSGIERFIRPMALAINDLKLPQEAEALAKKAAETHPETAMAENLLGWAALAKDDLNGARSHLEEALRRDPELDAAHLNFGQLAERAGNLAEARMHYEQAVELSEKNGNSSIGNTAALRYNGVRDTDVPSLSLE